MPAMRHPTAARPLVLATLVALLLQQAAATTPTKRSRLTGVYSETPVTLVTALLDIGRGEHGRSLDQYKQWMAITLRIRTPMVVYVSTVELQEWVLQQRMGLQTVVMVMAAEDLPYHWLSSYISYVTSKPEWKDVMHPPFHGQSVEYKLPLYIPTVFSKFTFMDKAAKTNRFNSKYFFWVDVGIGRWAQAAVNNHWPNMTKLYEQVPRLKDGVPTYIMQMTAGALPDKATLNVTKEMTTLGNYVAAGVMGGDAAAIRTVRLRAHKFILEMMKHGFANNEQCFLALDAVKHPELYHLIKWQCPPHGCVPTLDGGHYITIFDWFGP